MKKLGVNIDHVATLRQARLTRYPDPVSAAAIVEKAGADQITIHLREDRRHIQDGDLRVLRNTVTTELNLELAANRGIVDIAKEVLPNVCTFVPEKRQELTTEGGIDVAGMMKSLRPLVKSLTDKSVVVSMFIDPEIKQIIASKESGANSIELHTGRYCELTAHLKGDEDVSQLTLDARKELERLKIAANKAREIGLYVAAGHGLNYNNTALVVKEIPEIVEYNIGHSIISRAVFIGLENAVREMKRLVER